MSIGLTLVDSGAHARYSRLHLSPINFFIFCIALSKRIRNFTGIGVLEERDNLKPRKTMTWTYD